MNIDELAEWPFTNNNLKYQHSNLNKPRLALPRLASPQLFISNDDITILSERNNLLIKRHKVEHIRP